MKYVDSADFDKISALVAIANDRLAKVQQIKQAFVPTDAAAAGANPMADPAMAGGAPVPGDPAMAGGGMAPPMDPAMMGGGAPMPSGPDPIEAFRSIVKEELAAAGLGGGAGAGMAGGGQIKPKIDINIEMMQIKKMLAKIVDALQIPMPASEMVATPEDLAAMAQGGGGAAGPPAPPKMASAESGYAYDANDPMLRTAEVRSKAAALAELLGSRK